MKFKHKNTSCMFCNLFNTIKVHVFFKVRVKHYDFWDISRSFPENHHWVSKTGNWLGNKQCIATSGIFCHVTSFIRWFCIDLFLRFSEVIAASWIHFSGSGKRIRVAEKFMIYKESVSTSLLTWRAPRVGPFFVPRARPPYPRLPSSWPPSPAASLTPAQPSPPVPSSAQPYYIFIR